MAEECTHDCSTCSANCSSKPQGIPKEELNVLSSVKHVIAVVSGAESPELDELDGYLNSGFYIE